MKNLSLFSSVVAFLAVCLAGTSFAGNCGKSPADNCQAPSAQEAQTQAQAQLKKKQLDALEEEDQAIIVDDTDIEKFSDSEEDDLSFEGEDSSN